MTERPPFVTVVSGVPRSGTSLVMRMLGAGGMELLTDGSRPPDAFNPGGYFEYAPAKSLDRDATWLPRAAGRAVKVVHALLPRLPEGLDYRVVLLERDLREVVRSQEALLAARGGTPDALGEERLVAIYRQQLARAARWAEARPGVALLHVRYAALLDDPRGAAASLSRFVGGTLDVERMAAVVDPGLHRHRV